MFNLLLISISVIFLSIFFLARRKELKFSKDILKTSNINMNIEKKEYLFQSKKKLKLFSLLFTIFILSIVLIPFILILIENYNIKEISEERYQDRMKDAVLIFVPSIAVCCLLLFFIIGYLNKLIKDQYTIIANMPNDYFKKFQRINENLSYLNKYNPPILIDDKHLYVFKMWRTIVIDINEIKTLKIVKHTYRGISFSVSIEWKIFIYFRFSSDESIKNYIVNELQHTNPKITFQ